ncbi:amino acid racemase [Bacillus sp. 3103sda1]|uniref:aspartate/glutamate racemase family protein n=1 Tax=Bacillus sp. 3103sda1 TaxID=2953808 RepID=UPI0020A13FF7|nr:amino acid racemase [Bacillus sp. 3103sda1]MCP1126246.1 amino acid racemase [Bacillus sp. 3103sda1]
MSKTIGILGGMGPAATLDLFHKIILNTPVQTEQEHHRIIIYNNPKIPPRTQHSYPLPELVKSAILLEKAGADFIIMPCNTAHIWLEQIKATIQIPFYSIIETTVESIFLEEKDSTNKKILLLATETTINDGLYQKAFHNTPYEIITPIKEEQNIIDNTIKDVKLGKISSNQYLKDLNRILNVYKEIGISVIIGGCTEIPLLFHLFKTDMKMVDPTLLLAKLAVQKAT